MGTNRVGVPNQMGGYDYSTNKKENTLFNQGVVPGAPGASQGSYDYSAKGRASRMYKMRNLTPPNTNQPAYGAKINAENMFNRQKSARGGK